MSTKPLAANPKGSKYPAVVARHEAAILDDWVARQLAASTRRADVLDERKLREQSRAFLKSFQEAAQSRDMENIDGDSWEAVREHLGRLAAERARVGFTPSETAIYVLSLKEPLFARLVEELSRDPAEMGRELWAVTKVLDALALDATESFAKTREEVIHRQQRDLLELSTPVVALWKDILALPWGRDKSAPAYTERLA